MPDYRWLIEISDFLIPDELTDIKCNPRNPDRFRDSRYVFGASSFILLKSRSTQKKKILEIEFYIKTSF